MPDFYFDVDAALTEVPVNIMPLIDDTDFKTRKTAIAYNESGMDLVWNFVTSAGAFTQTAVTPTTSGNYDWTHQGDGMYSIEIPASGGASINNDTEGYGWFTGLCAATLPWRGPTIGFRASGLNDLLCDSAYSTTRGLAGTALPAAAAEAAGGLFTRGTGAGQINQDGNGRIDTNIAAVSTDTTAADNLELMFDGTGYAGGAINLGVNAVNIAANVITSSALASSAVNEIADQVWDEVISGHVGAGSAGEIIAAILTDTGTTLDGKIDTIDTVVDAILVDTGTTLDGKIDVIDGIVDSILVDTAEIGVAGAGLTNINLPNQTMDIIGNITGNLSGSVGSVTVVSDKTGYRLSATGVDDIHDEVVDGSLTARQSMRLLNSSAFAKLSGAATTTVTIRDAGDTKDRITATVDADGNRTAITTDAT